MDENQGDCMRGFRAVKKILEPFGEKSRKSRPFGFWLRFGSVTGFCRSAPSPKPRQKPKILAPNWLQYFFNRFDIHCARRGWPGIDQFSFSLSLSVAQRFAAL